jgi:hypothetical protein
MPFNQNPKKRRKTTILKKTENPFELRKTIKLFWLHFSHIKIQN